MRKRLLSTLLALCMVLSLLPPGIARAEDAPTSGSCGDNVTWVLYADGTLVISGSGTMDDYNSDYSYMPWDSNRSYIKTVMIEDGVTSIGDETFFRCDSLTNATIPTSVTSIGERAFEYCSSLTSVIIPESVTSIETFAFDGCNSDLCIYCYSGSYAESYAIINHIKFSLLDGDDDTVVDFGICGDILTWVLYKDGTLAIKEVAGLYDGGMYDYDRNTLPPWYNYREQIRTASIGSGVTEIGKCAFLDCTSLTSVTIPESVTSIESSAFSGCSSLTSVIIPEKVTSIGDWVFSDCTSLNSVTIPESVTSIGDSAFSNCSSLTSVIIPESVTSIGSLAFWNCSSLTSAGPIGGYYDYQFGWKTAIPDNAFSGCNGLASVTIPVGVVSIGDSAFHICSSLTSVTIPESVTSIGEEAFSNCSSLASVTIPGSVTSVEDFTFYYCTSLTNVIISDGVTSIGYDAFGACSSLTSVRNFEKLTFQNGQ